MSLFQVGGDAAGRTPGADRLEPRFSFPRRTGVLVGGIALVYALLLLAFDGLAFAPRKDEVHFWPTSLQFSQWWIPPAELLRSYRELNTPLPFLAYGWVERLLGGGIQVARAVNLLWSAAILLLVALAGRSTPPARAAAVVGILACPYFVFVSVHAYTDILAILCVVAGLALHARGRFLAAGIAFALGIASRQYMVAFPAAIVGYELLSGDSIRDRPGRWGLPLAAVATLGGWFLFFGGFGPTVEIAAQKIQTGQAAFVYPHNALYFLACVGLYYVIPELALFRGSPVAPPPVGRGALIAAAALLGLFVAFPPLENTNFPVRTMGYLDIAVRVVAGDLVRVGIFYLLALLALLRFRRPDLPALLVWMHAAMMIKAHIAWDKYALPLLVVLWFVQAGGGPARLVPRSLARMIRDREAAGRAIRRHPPGGREAIPEPT